MEHLSPPNSRANLPCHKPPKTPWANSHVLPWARCAAATSSSVCALSPSTVCFIAVAVSSSSSSGPEQRQGPFSQRALAR
jgi:hypothetical protein